MDARQNELLKELLVGIEFREDQPKDDDIERLALLFTDWGTSFPSPFPKLHIAKWSGTCWKDQNDQAVWEGPEICVVAYAWL